MKLGASLQADQAAASSRTAFPKGDAAIEEDTAVHEESRRKKPRLDSDSSPDAERFSLTLSQCLFKILDLQMKTSL